MKIAFFRYLLQMLFYSDPLPLSTPRSKKLQLEQESRFTGNHFISGANYYTLLLYIALYIILYYTYTLYLWLLHTIPSWWENSLIFFFGAQKVFFTLENDRLFVLISRMRLHSLVLIMFLIGRGENDTFLVTLSCLFKCVDQFVTDSGQIFHNIPKDVTLCMFGASLCSASRENWIFLLDAT